MRPYVGWKVFILLHAVLAVLAGTASLHLRAQFLRSFVPGPGDFVSKSCVLLALGTVLSGGLAVGCLARVVECLHARSNPGVRGDPDLRSLAGIASIACTCFGLEFCLLAFDPRLAADSIRLLPRLFWFGCLGILVTPIHVAIHELGHFVGGALVGVRIGSIRILWITIHRTDRALQLGWSAPDVPGVLGYCRASPGGIVRAGFRAAVFAFAGPAATLVASFLCFAATALVATPTTCVRVTTSLTLWAGVVTGLWIALGSLVPHRTRSGGLSDGARILYALWYPDSTRLAAQFVAMHAAGRPPRDWGMGSEELLAAAERAPYLRELLLLASLLVALDHRDIVLARQLLAAVHEGAHPVTSFAEDFDAEAALIEAFAGDIASARVRVERLAVRPLAAGLIHLVNAALSCMQDRPAEARSALVAWNEATSKQVALRVGYEWAEDEIRRRFGIG